MKLALVLGSTQIQSYSCTTSNNSRGNPILIWVSSEKKIHDTYRWEENQEASLSRIDDVSYGVDTGPIVVSLEVAMFNKLVVLDVTLHLLPAHKVKILSVYLVGTRGA